MRTPMRIQLDTFDRILVAPRLQTPLDKLPRRKTAVALVKRPARVAVYAVVLYAMARPVRVTIP